MTMEALAQELGILPQQCRWLLEVAEETYKQVLHDTCVREFGGDPAGDEE